MSVEAFIYDLPKQEREMCLRLREIVLQNAPGLEELFSYGVPYYFRNRRVCCIWPAAAAGGPKRGVFLGFCNGNLLSNEQGIIEMGNRKRFGLIRYADVKEINEQVISEILQEAILVDDGMKGVRRR